MSAIGKIIKSGERYVLGSEEEYGELASRYLSHHDILEASDWKLRYAPDYYNKRKLQAIGNKLHKAKKRIDSNTRTGKPSGVNERPEQASEVGGEAPELSAAQAVKEASGLNPEAPGTSTGTIEAAPTGEGGASTKVKDSDVQTRKTDITNVKTKEQLKDETGKNAQTTGTGTETPGEGQPTDGTGGGTQTADVNTKIPDERQAAQSGGGYNPAEFMEKAKDQNLGSSERQMYGRLGTMRANAQKVFDKGTDEQIKNELGRWGIETEEGAKATAEDYMEKIDEILQKKAESGPTLGDKFKAHHGVGLTGLGVVGVSTLDLASSRGQQSNAQLYSDPFA